MTLALTGIKILEVARYGIVSYCNMILGDAGAEVIKIEQPPADDSGSIITASPVSGDERTAAYYALNRNKKSIAINLNSKEGKEIFYKLAERSDVIVEGFKPGVMKRLGVGYEKINEINPRIIYCSISGYGQDGPYRDMPGHDINYISIAGLLGLIGDRGGHPVIPLNIGADWAGGGLHATIGILIALMARERTGKGQYIDISMTDGTISLLTNMASWYFLTGKVPKRGETLIGGAFPYYGVYETKDGKFLSIGCVEPKFWENLCRALGREDIIPFQFAKGEKREEVLFSLRQTFLTKTRKEWVDLLKSEETCIAPIYDFDEFSSDPHVLHRKMVVEIDHPTEGKVKQIGCAIKLSDTPAVIRNLAPTLGQNTDEELQCLGYTVDKIKELRQTGIIM